MQNRINKRINLLSIVLWGVVSYAVALLTYCTMKNVFNASEGYISAFGSILGACGTFFAAFIAVYLFVDWTVSAKFNQKKEVIDTFWSNYIEVRTILVSLKDRAVQADAQDPKIRIELFDSTSLLITKLYYHQQKIELYFNIKEDDQIWSELESISEGYIRLLEFNIKFDKNWIYFEEKLTKRLIALQPKLYKNLKNLNQI